MIENASMMGARFLAGLRHINSPAVKEVRGRGLMIAVELHPHAGGARAGPALQPTSDEKYPRPLGFSAFGFDRRDDEVIDKRFVAAHESGCDLVDDARSLQRSPIGYSLQSNRAY